MEYFSDSELQYFLESLEEVINENEEGFDSMIIDDLKRGLKNGNTFLIYLKYINKLFGGDCSEIEFHKRIKELR